MSKDDEVDEHGNDIKILKKCEELSDNTQKETCPIHKKSYESHNDDELMDDYNVSLVRYQKSKGHLYHTDQIEPKGITTFAELTKLGLSNYDLQAGVASNTRKDFKTLLDLSGRIAGYYMTFIDEVATHDVTTKLGLCSLLLAARNQRLTGSATNLICDGYYEVAMPIIRTSLENYLLMLYLKDHPEIVDDFWNQKITIRSKKLVNYGKNEMPWLGEHWHDLCESYTHANIVSMHSIAFNTDEKETTGFHTLPYYDKEKADAGLVTSIFMKWETFILFMKIFPDILKNMKGFAEDFASMSIAFSEYLKNKNIKIEFSSMRGNN